MMKPFDYPQRPHERRHGPRGYNRPESYRPWLRDEFAFCCVYCLDREQWHRYMGTFVVEHFLPVASHPERETEYGNLVYACVACNLTKAQRHVPDPTHVLLQESVVVQEDGRIEALTKESAKLIDKLLLNSEDCQAFRRRWISIMDMAERHAPDLYRELLAYPADLPDLSRLRPPADNDRPQGIAQSHYARRQRGELSETY
jgi:hypothetical protein